MTEKENALTPNEKREEVINQILINNEISEVVSHSEAGDSAAVFARFTLLPGDRGGFADIAEHEELMQETIDRIDEKIMDAEAEGKPIENNWDLYESVGREVRKEALQDGNYPDLYRDPGPSFEDNAVNERQEAIAEMRKSRRQA